MKASSQYHDAGVAPARRTRRATPAAAAVPPGRPVVKSVGRRTRLLYCDSCGHKRTACICDGGRRA